METRADQVTGEDDDVMREYGCPVSWFRRSERDTQRMRVGGSGEAAQEDMQQLEDMGDLSKAVSVEPPVSEPEVKKEKLSDAEVLQQDYNKFQAEISDHLGKFQQMQLETQQMINKLAAEKYAHELEMDIKKNQGRIANVIKLLLRGSSEKIEIKAYGKLVTAMAQVSAAHDGQLAHAARF